VSQAGDGLQFGGLERDLRNARLVGKLDGIEQPTERDRDLLLDEQAHFAGELVLAGDPVGIGGWAEAENGRTADRRGGKAGHEREQRLPLESGEVGIGNRRGDGIEQGHGLPFILLSFAFRRFQRARSPLCHT